MKLKDIIIKFRRSIKASPFLLFVPIPLLYFALFITHGVSFENITHDNSPFDDSIQIVHVITTGDAMMHKPQIISGQDSINNVFDFYPVFQYLAPIINGTDLRIVNFETTLAGPPYSGYPQFCAPDTIAYVLKQTGFNFFVNANNHAVDKRALGINRTIDVFDKYGIQHTGTFKNAAERKKKYPVLLRMNGIKIAILNCTYGTNALVPPVPTIINYIDTVQLKDDLKAAADSLPDAIFVCIHWGTEYQREPNEEQKKIADFLFRNGVDVIIGSHPHVIQPIEERTFKYKGKDKKGLVIWSLGNFVSNQREPYRNGGMFVKFDLRKNIFSGQISITNISYIPFWVYKAMNPVKYFVLPVYRFENDSSTIKMNSIDRQTFRKFISDTRTHLRRDTANIKEYFPEKL